MDDHHFREVEWSWKDYFWTIFIQGGCSCHELNSLDDCHLGTVQQLIKSYTQVILKWQVTQQWQLGERPATVTVELSQDADLSWFGRGIPRIWSWKAGHWEVTLEGRDCRAAVEVSQDRDLQSGRVICGGWSQNGKQVSGTGKESLHGHCLGFAWYRTI